MIEKRYAAPSPAVALRDGAAEPAQEERDSAEHDADEQPVEKAGDESLAESGFLFRVWVRILLHIVPALSWSVYNV